MISPESNLLNSAPVDVCSLAGPTLVLCLPLESIEPDCREFAGIVLPSNFPTATRCVGVMMVPNVFLLEVLVSRWRRDGTGKLPNDYTLYGHSKEAKALGGYFSEIRFASKN